MGHRSSSARNYHFTGSPITSSKATQRCCTVMYRNQYIVVLPAEIGESRKRKFKRATRELKAALGSRLHLTSSPVFTQTQLPPVKQGFEVHSGKIYPSSRMLSHCASHLQIHSRYTTNLSCAIIKIKHIWLPSIMGMV